MSDKIPVNAWTAVKYCAWSYEDNGEPITPRIALFDKRICFAKAKFSEYKPKKETVEMRSPEKLRQDILQYVPKGEVKKIPVGLKGKMVGEFNRIWGGDINRRIITGWIFTGDFASAMSTTKLTETQIAALLDWLQPVHEKDGWGMSPTFRGEAALVYAYVAQEHVKTESFKAKGTSETAKMKLPPQLLKALA